MQNPPNTPNDVIAGLNISIDPNSGDIEMYLGEFNVNESKKIKFKVNCTIPKVKVIFEQETNSEDHEVKNNSLEFKNASEKNLLLGFEAIKSREVFVLVKVEKLRSNNIHSNEDLKKYEKRIILKYRTKLGPYLYYSDSDIKILEQIGSGNEGNIYMAELEGKIIAIKQFKNGGGQKEIENMTYCENECIVKTYGYCKKEIGEDYSTCLVMEYIKNGSLKHKIGSIEQPILYKIMQDVCEALKFLHKTKNVVHRDIKPDNILICDHETIVGVNAKLTDFGISNVIDDTIVDSFGTQLFRAPEMSNGENYSDKCDIYSLGITMLVCFLKIPAEKLCKEGILSDVKKENGTYITNVSRLENSIRKLIIKCCQIEPSKRPDVVECLKSIQQIREQKNNEKNQIGVEKAKVRYSIPKFDLKESVENVVNSIKQLNVENKFIKALLMLKFNKDLNEVISILQELNNDTECYGKVDYTLAKCYLKIGDPNNIKEVYNLMIKAADKSYPEAIMYLIDILISIDDGKIFIVDDDEKLHLKQIINEVCELNPELNYLIESPTKITKGCETIPSTIVVNIFEVLGKYISLCKLQYGFALLHGIGVSQHVVDAKTIITNASSIKDPQEIEFYKAYCEFTKGNTKTSYKNTHYMLDNCIKFSEKQYYYSDVLNNKGVLLYKGLGCEKDINKAFEYFKQSMKLNNDYGKFNYAFCLCEHQETFFSSPTKEEGLKIIKELANNGFSDAQHYYSIECYNEYTKDKRNELFENFVYWSVKATRQSNYATMTNIGTCLLNGDGVKKHELIGFELTKIASNNGNLRAKTNLMKCYRFGKCTTKNLKEANRLCEEIENNKEEIPQTDVQYLHLRILLDLYKQNKDETTKAKIQELFEILERKDHKGAICDLGVCYLNGLVFEKNPTAAIEYFEKAGEKGRNAIFQLGILYFHGDGVEMDKEKAKKLLTLANELGHPKAKDFLKEHFLSLNDP
ncbi:Protein kinase domain-containing protein [Entamoeba marina]